jgi:plasmid stability protein
MKNVQIRNVPEKTHSVLRRRAAAAGMSLQEYLLGMVNEAAARPSLEEVLRRAAKSGGARFGLQDAVADLRSERDSG